MKNIRYETKKSNMGFQELVYSDENINIIVVNKQRNNTHKNIKYNICLKEISVGSIVGVEMLRESECDGKIEFKSYHRKAVVLEAFPKDELDCEYLVEYLDTLKHKSYLRNEHIVEVF